VTKADTVTSY